MRERVRIYKLVRWCVVVWIRTSRIFLITTLKLLLISKYFTAGEQPIHVFILVHTSPSLTKVELIAFFVVFVD